MGTEWLRYEEPGGPLMGLADRVKALRNEQGWSQSELAELVGAQPRYAGEGPARRPRRHY